MKINAKERDLNGRATTMRWLREHPEEAEQRQWDIMNHNATAARKMIERVATLPLERRMVRLGSEMLQGYTEPNWIEWWQQPHIQNHLAKIFAPVGEASRRLGVKISFHPGQFCVLSSHRDDVAEFRKCDTLVKREKNHTGPIFKEMNFLFDGKHASRTCNRKRINRNSVNVHFC